VEFSLLLEEPGLRLVLHAECGVWPWRKVRKRADKEARFAWKLHGEGIKRV
jgi:hypothetical protein